MDQRTSPLPRIKPLPPEHSPELKEQFEAMRKNLGFIPNSILIMQRKPKLAKALAQMTAAVWDPEGKVDRGFKRIIAHVASRAAGCQYCMAHTAGGALHFGVEDKSSPRSGSTRRARFIALRNAQRLILPSRQLRCPTR
jgi:alkylhydroperoxidase family enzyme